MPERLSHDRKSSQAVVNTGQEVIHTHAAVRSSGQVSSQHCPVLVMDRADVRVMDICEDDQHQHHDEDRWVSQYWVST